MKSRCPLAIVCAQLLAPCVFGAEPERSLNFLNDVEPILTKAACNAGGCHAKAGDRAARLSLVVARVRAAGRLRAHREGGAKGGACSRRRPSRACCSSRRRTTCRTAAAKRLDPKSEGYKTVVRWISEGMSYAKDTDPKLVSIEVQPKRGRHENPRRSSSSRCSPIIPMARRGT